VNENELRDHVIACLHRVAPEADLHSLAPDADLRETLELDSLDFLTFVDELFTRTGVDVPERDYPSVTSLERAVSYLTRRLMDHQPT
jgi:acyl carrier protein